MTAAYNAAQGRITEILRLSTISQQAGVDRELGFDLACYLESKGLIQDFGTSGDRDCQFRITSRAIDVVEKIEANSAVPPGPVQTNVNGNNNTVVVATDGSSVSLEQQRKKWWESLPDIMKSGLSLAFAVI